MSSWLQNTSTDFKFDPIGKFINIKKEIKQAKIEYFHFQHNN